MIEDFLGVENVLDFKFNSTRSFHCLQSPVPMCLSAGKGLTRHAKIEINTQSKVLTDLYKEEMVNLSRSLNEFPTMDSSGNRFEWLQRYVDLK